jgi:hypothetical protein
MSVEWVGMEVIVPGLVTRATTEPYAALPGESGLRLWDQAIEKRDCGSPILCGLMAAADADTARLD